MAVILSLMSYPLFFAVCALFAVANGDGISHTFSDRASNCMGYLARTSNQPERRYSEENTSFRQRNVRRNIYEVDAPASREDAVDYFTHVLSATSNPAFSPAEIPQGQFMTLTKQVSTLGPSTCTADSLRSIMEAGTDIYRLNFSHGTRLFKLRLTRMIRQLELVRSSGEGSDSFMVSPKGILGDIQGPKLRIGRFMPNVDAVGKGIESSAAEFVELKKGDKFTFDTHDVKGSQTRVRFNFPDILRDLNVGNTIAMDDGNLNLEVISVDRDAPSVTAVVLNDGVLSSRKGFAVPNVAITVDLFSEKDVKDTIFSYALGLDFLGVSFVQRMTDILYLKNIILDFAGSSYMQPLLDRIDAIDMNSINTEDEDPEIEAILQEYYIERFLPAKQHLMTALPHLENVGIAIIPKIEKQPALDDINGILEVSDGMMIARGDLGVETEITNLPVIQKRLIQLCRLVYHKPVIVATQMLESMKSNPKPSRAEATDCANAVYDGADAVMLSAESATGAYPAHSVRTQRLLLYNAENDPYFNAEQLLRESLLNEDIMSKLSSIRPREVAKIMSLVELDMLATREWNNRHALLRDAANDVSMVIASEDVDALIVHVDDKPELIQWIATKRHTLPIVMLTSRIELARRMLLTWSVKPHMLPDCSDAATYAEEIAPLYVGKDSKVMYIECEDNKVLSSVVIDLKKGN